MDKEPKTLKGRYSIKRIFFFSLAAFVVLLVGTGIYVYSNFNRLLSEALLKSYNNTVVSDVYELSFKKLRVNLLRGDIKILDATLLPRTKPLKYYPYINSTLHLKAKKILLDEVQIVTLLKTGKLILQRIQISQPEIVLQLAGDNNNLLPFADTVATSPAADKNAKSFITSFLLQEFVLEHASIKVNNTGCNRNYLISDLTITLSELLLGQQKGVYNYKMDALKLAVASVSGSFLQQGMRSIKLENFNLQLLGLEAHKSVDTLQYKFNDFVTGIQNLEIVTADSVYSIGMKTFELSYAGKTARLGGLSFKPNVSRARLQSQMRFQTANVSFDADSVAVKGIQFDSLLYNNKLLVEDINIKGVDATVYKDKTKPVDRNKLPLYPAQQLQTIGFPIQINKVSVSGLTIRNMERKPDGNTAKVTINRCTLTARNLTNGTTTQPLRLSANAWIENAVPFALNLSFSYRYAYFSMNGSVGAFSLKSLNKLIADYTPATITKGRIDGVTFNAQASSRRAKGEMKFLYHDLGVDLKLQDKKKWQNSIINFAANTYLLMGNPALAGQPPRIVKFTAERDMNKAFINLILRSFMAGMRETLVMSKENRKAVRETRKQLRKQKRK